MSSFERNKRAIFLKEENFLEYKEFLEEDKLEDVFLKPIPDWIKDNKEKSANYHKGLSWHQCSNQLKFTFILYSAGYPMIDVVQQTTDMLERFSKHHDIDFKDEKYYLWEADSYIYILWLLGLAILTNNQEILQRIPTWIGGKDQNDPNPIPYVDKPIKALLDLIGYQGVVRVAEKELFPKSCFRLIPQIIEANQAKRPTLLTQYLKEWYKSNKNTYWYGNHERKLFVGYWAFEAGALAYLLKITSEEVNQSEFYPVDYVNWAIETNLKVS